MTARDVGLAHQLKIARATLKMNDTFARVMGGMTKAEAAALLRKHGQVKDWGLVRAYEQEEARRKS